MSWRWTAACGLIAAALAAACAAPAVADAPAIFTRELDAPFEVTHVEVVQAMLTSAGVTAQDNVYDLGCGDGRFVIMAARRFGARGVGVDLDPQRVREAREIAAHEGVADRTEFRVQDALLADLRSATVVTLYMGDDFDVLIRPTLFRELAPGSRVVSHAFRMGEWEADRVLSHPKARGNTISLWTIPAPVGGVWRWDCGTGPDKMSVDVALQQEFQVLRGHINVPGALIWPLDRATIAGRELTLSTTLWRVSTRKTMKVFCRGTVDGDVIRGTQEWQGGPEAGPLPWTARRDPVTAVGRWQVRPAFRKDLEGTLSVAPGGSATYVLDDGGKELPVPALYLWGASLRFEIPGTGRPVVFTGTITITGDAAGGTFGKQEWPQLLAWSAKRVGDANSVAALAGTKPDPAAVPPEAPAPSIPAAPPAPTPGTAAPAATGLPAPLKTRRWTAAMGEPQVGDEWVSAKDGSVLTWIPGGTFLMGGDASDDEKPIHPVKVDGFWLGKFEVTNRQYARFLEERPKDAEPPFLWDNPNYTQPDQPVVGVTLQAAVAYCRWAGVQLPTEAQWEYAAAGGRQLKYPTATGEISHDLANYGGTSGKGRGAYTSPVGSFPPNPFGLYDMAGNAWEWTWSKLAPYPYSSTDGREAPTDKGLWVLRGGCWYYPADYCRTAARHRFESHLRYEYSGFRVMLPRKGTATLFPWVTPPVEPKE